MYISAWEKSALGNKRTRLNPHYEKGAHVQENTTQKIIFISLLCWIVNKGIRLFTISLCSSKHNYFSYPFVVCDIGRSHTLWLVLSEYKKQVVFYYKKQKTIQNLVFFVFFFIFFFMYKAMFWVVFYILYGWLHENNC